MSKKTTRITLRYEANRAANRADGQLKTLPGGRSKAGYLSANECHPRRDMANVTSSQVPIMNIGKKITCRLDVRFMEIRDELLLLQKK